MDVQRPDLDAVFLLYMGVIFLPETPGPRPHDGGRELREVPLDVPVDALATLSELSISVSKGTSAMNSATAPQTAAAPFFHTDLSVVQCVAMPGVTIEVTGLKETTNRGEKSKQQARFENASSVALSAAAQRLERFLKNRVA